MAQWVRMRCVLASALCMPAWSSTPSYCREVSPVQSRSAVSVKSSSQRCSVAEKKAPITINCGYLPEKKVSSTTSRIAITHASFTFDPKNESHMRLQITFVNDSSYSFTEARSVYLAIDDNHGQNVVRRTLPHVDFSRIKPRQAVTFSEVLLIPALSPGDYVIHLWIPSSDPSLKFDAKHNFLLRNSDVADFKRGLNSLATFYRIDRFQTVAPCGLSLNDV